MSIHTIRLDKTLEQELQYMAHITGWSMSSVFKKGLKLVQKDLTQHASCSPYAIYKSIDMGEGGKALGQSSQVKLLVKKAIQRKLQQ